MNAHESYFKAVVPDPVTILGLELRPFCAGHIVLLHRVNSVFITGGEYSQSELATAVALCSFTFEDGIAFLMQDSEKTEAQMREWREKIGEFNLVTECANFEKYMRDGSDFPLVFSPNAGSALKPLTSLPSVHAVRCRLMHYYGKTESEFWNMPWSLAQWDYFTVPVMEGRADLIEKDIMDEAKKFAEEDFKRCNPHLFDAEGNKLNA